MAWIQCVEHKDGTKTYWIRDKKNGREIVIDSGSTMAEAEYTLSRYELSLQNIQQRAK